MSKLSSSSLRINVSDAERLRKSMACKHSAGETAVLRCGVGSEVKRVEDVPRTGQAPPAIYASARPAMCAPRVKTPRPMKVRPVAAQT